MRENPIRLEFYEKYKRIIEEYNAGKDIQAVQKAFDDLNDFMQNDLSPEQERAMREGLDEETLAIYDLLKKPSLTKAEEKDAKKVAKETLEKLKAEKLKVERWRESTQEIMGSGLALCNPRHISNSKNSLLAYILCRDIKSLLHNSRSTAAPVQNRLYLRLPNITIINFAQQKRQTEVCLFIKSKF